MEAIFGILPLSRYEEDCKLQNSAPCHNTLWGKEWLSSPTADWRKPALTGKARHSCGSTREACSVELGTSIQLAVTTMVSNGSLHWHYNYSAVAQPFSHHCKKALTVHDKWTISWVIMDPDLHWWLCNRGCEEWGTQRSSFLCVDNSKQQISRLESTAPTTQQK